jgi:hypothetical protein
MAKYISLDPKMMGTDSARLENQTINVYRMITVWLTAALIERGPLHLSAASLAAAAVHLEGCEEKPTFRIEGVGDGCQLLELVRGSNGNTPQSSPSTEGV